MPFTFSVIALIVTFTASLLFGALNFSFWYVQREDRTSLWMVAWLCASLVYSLCRLLQYVSLNEDIYIWIPRLLLTSGYSLAWWGYGLGNSFISYRPRPWERNLVALLVALPVFVLWSSDLVLTKQVIVRAIAFGGEYHGVKTGPLYIFTSILVLILGLIPLIRLFSARGAHIRENRLLGMGYSFVILFSLNDFFVTFFNLTWPRLSDYSSLPTSIALSLILAQRLGRLYQHMDIDVQKRTVALSQANEALRASESRYRLLFDSAPVGILLADLYGQVLAVNASALQLLGSPSVDATQSINLFTFPPLIEAGISADLKKCFASQEGVDQEYRYTSKWGKQIDARVRYTPIQNETGSNSLVQLIIEDTSERIRAEKLQQSVYEIARAAVTTQSLDQLYAKIHTLLQNLLPTQYFYIALYDRENDIVSFPYMKDVFDQAPLPAKPGRGMTEYVLRTRKPLLATQEVFQELIRRREIELIGPKMVNWLGVPLITQGQAIGVMVAQSYDDAVHFTQKDLEVMSYVSTQVANAIERKRAEEELHRGVDELTALYQTTLDIINKRDLPELLNTIVSRAVDLLGGTSGCMYLCEPELEQVRCVVSSKTQYNYVGTILAYGEGAAGTVVTTGESLIIDDYQTWGGRANVYEGIDPFGAVISVPMIWQDQVTGVIHVSKNIEPQKFTNEDLRLLTSFANQAAIAVENARLFTEITQRAGELEISAKVAAALRVAETIDEMLPILLEETAEAVNAGSSSIYLLDQECGDYICYGSYPPNSRLIGLRHPPGKGIVGHVALTGEIYLTEDITLDPKANILHEEREMLAGLQGLITLPLFAQDEIIGVMQFALKKENTLSKDDVHLLTSIMDMAANAIHRARLFEAANRRLKRLTALRRIDQAITSNLDLKLTLNILLAQILQQLDVDAASALLYMPELQSLEFVAGEGFTTQVMQSTRLRLGQGYAGRAAQ